MPLRSKYQTLPEFILSPFNNGKSSLSRDIKYDSQYQKYIGNHSIYIKATTVIDESYYYLIKVPSESTNTTEYDVVIRFFTDDNLLKRETHLRHYKIQFYSNCPSFMYQFAYLYAQEGYLIKSLYGKVGDDFLNNPPTKSNADMNITYDKSIYFACKFLSSNKYDHLNKISMANTIKRVSNDKFFNLITDFNSAITKANILNEEKKLKKELDKQGIARDDRNSTKKKPVMSTFKKGFIKIQPLKKKSGKAKKRPGLST